jgi:cobalt/nickel transport system ATP-binding protein
LLVLDEPFEGLDPASRSDLVELLNRLHREQGVSLVMATHDINAAALMADRVYVLVGGGEIVAQGPPCEIFRDPGLLRRSNVEPPVLAELFQRLEERGVALGRPVTAEEAARAILAWTAQHSSCKGAGDLGPLFTAGGGAERSVSGAADPGPGPATPERA